MKIILLVCSLIFIAFILLRVFENRSVFAPAKYPSGFWQPDAFGLNLEDCYFYSTDGSKLHGWFFKSEKPEATLLWSHGNAGNISDRLDNLSKLVALPFNIFLYDYRGYGKSAGKPSEEGVYQDSQAAYDYLLTRPEVDPEKIVIYGRSLGGAVAIDLATKRPCSSLILESTFTSAQDMAQIQFGALPIRWLMSSEFNSTEKIENLEVPILILHGDQDNIVPYNLGKQLFSAANEPKEFYKIKGADHNDTYLVGGNKYYEKIKSFILDHL